MSRELQRKREYGPKETGRGVDLSGLRVGSVAGSCEQGTESPGSIKGRSILE
jgi:hypothetical protein